MKKIYLTLNAPALEAMVDEVYTAGTVASYSEAVGVLLRELLERRGQRTASAAQSVPAAPASEPPTEDKLGWGD